MVYGEVPGVSPLQPLPDAYLLWPQLSLARAVYLINFQCGTMARCPRWGDGDSDGAGLPGDGDGGGGGGSSPSAELHGCIRALYLAALGYALLAVAIDTYGTDLGQVRTECRRLTSRVVLRARLCLCLCMACGRSRSKQRSSGCYVGTTDDGKEEMPLPSSHLAAKDSNQRGAVIDAGASAAVPARARASAQSSTLPLVIDRLSKTYPPASSTTINPLRTLWQRASSDCTRGDTTACPLPTRDLATNTAAPSASATGGQQVVKDFSLAVRSGECFALLGKNGAGKTSLIKCLTGHHPPDSSSCSGSGSGSGGNSGGSDGGGGDAWIGGHSIRTSLRRAQLKLGVCPQYR